MHKVIIDATRSIDRTMQGRLPTGVDRVVLEYIRHFSADSRALVRLNSRWVLLANADSEKVFSALLQVKKGFKSWVQRCVAKSFFNSNDDLHQANVFLINAGHSGLENKNYIKKLASIQARPLFFVHDLIPISHPEYCRPGELQRHQLRMQTVLTYAHAVVVNSQATLDELRAFALAQALPMPPAAVAWLAAADLPLQALPRPVPGPYFVMLGTIEARKNHAFILQLWRQLVLRLGAAAPKLVIIGQRGWECENALDLLERCPALQGHVLEIGRCTDIELAAYLQHGQALLFPSFAEGFGMPIVEAFAQKLPVLCSDLPAFHEIAGDIPEYIDPLDGARWLALIGDYCDSQHPLRVAQLARMAGFVAPTWADHFVVVDQLLASLDPVPV